jgi:D-alanyl-D-alanine carboxypeptidase (penicillin-binding protein 5/6)
MKPIALIALASSFLVSLPGQASAPPYSTPAPIAFLKDLSSGAVLYAKDADRRIPPASMAKMMTVYVAFDLIRKGEVKLDQRISVRPETWRKWHGPAAGSTMFLSPGEEVTVRDLLQGIVTVSGNDACVVLAEGLAGTEPAFVALMNQTAKRIGLANSNFGNSNGWPDEGVTYVTARDLATLAERTIQDFPDLYKSFYSQTEMTWNTKDGKTITQANRDPLLGRVAGADGLKTGHTEEAGYGFTGSAEQNGRRLVMVVSGLTGFNQRIEESVAFIEWGFRAWKSVPLVKAGRRVQTAEVQLGDAREVGLVAPRDLAVTLPVGAAGNMKVRVVYDGPVKAPIAKGQPIASLVVTTGDTPPQRMPLVAEAAVGEAGFFDRLMAGFRWLFGIA